MQFLADTIQHSIHILDNLIVPEPNNAESLLFQELRPDFVSIVLFGVVPAIQFKDKLRFKADKIDYVFSDGPLAAKSMAFDLLVPNFAPEHTFGISCVPAQGARDTYHRTRPHPGLPPLGEGRSRYADGVTSHLSRLT